MFYRLDLSIEGAAYIQQFGVSPTSFTGDPLMATWGERPCKVIGEEWYDFFYCCPGAPACSDRVKEIIGNLAPDEIELLPLITARGEIFYVLNSLLIQDCLDVDLSVVERFPDGRVYAVNDYVFRRENVEAKYLFRIKQAPSAAIFCTKEFKEMVEKNNFMGVRFEKIKTEMEVDNQFPHRQTK